MSFNVLLLWSVTIHLDANILSSQINWQIFLLNI